MQHWHVFQTAVYKHCWRLINIKITAFCQAHITEHIPGSGWQKIKTETDREMHCPAK